MFRITHFAVFILLVLAIAAGCAPIGPADLQPAVLTKAPTQTPLPPTTVPAETEPPVTEADALVAALAAHLGASADELTVVIEEQTEAHARGGVDNGYFLAAKVDGAWIIVADGQGAIPCDAVAQYGFPAGMVEECAYAMLEVDSITAALIEHLEVEAGELAVRVEENTGTHARGLVENGYFLAAKVDGAWVIVADGQGAIPCDAVAQFSFPSGMVPECAYATLEVDSITAALAEHLDVKAGELAVRVEENTGMHARGLVENGYFLAAKVEGEWVIVADGQGAIDCETVSDYDFPAAMVPECGE
jgi:hypothetical protein